MSENKVKFVCFTLHSFTEDHIGAIKDLVPSKRASYCVYQTEVCPKTKKQHLQGYIELVCRTKYTTLKNLLKAPGVHLEARRGTSSQAAEYCKKDESRLPGSLIYEEGEISTVSQGKRNDLVAIAELITEEGGSLRDVAIQYPASYMRMHKGIEKFKSTVAPVRDKQTVCLAVWGEPQCGKSTWIKETYPDACWITKGVSGCWLDLYDAHSTIVFDEFTGWMPYTWFKRLIDQTPLSLDAKQSSRNMVPGLVIFTSNTDPEDWYSGEVLNGLERAAFKRRLHNVVRVERVPGNITEGKPWFSFSCTSCMIPFNACFPANWRFGLLSPEESFELINSHCDDLRRNSLINKSGVTGVRVSGGGVILNPPLFPNSHFVGDALTHLACYLFGTSTTPAGELPVAPTPLVAASLGESSTDVLVETASLFPLLDYPASSNGISWEDDMPMNPSHTLTRVSKGTAAVIAKTKKAAHRSPFKPTAARPAGGALGTAKGTQAALPAAQFKTPRPLERTKSVSTKRKSRSPYVVDEADEDNVRVARAVEPDVMEMSERDAFDYLGSD